MYCNAFILKAAYFLKADAAATSEQMQTDCAYYVVCCVSVGGLCVFKSELHSRQQALSCLCFSSVLHCHCVTANTLICNFKTVCVCVKNSHAIERVIRLNPQSLTRVHKRVSGRIRAYSESVQHDKGKIYFSWLSQFQGFKQRPLLAWSTKY